MSISKFDCDVCDTLLGLVSGTEQSFKTLVTYGNDLYSLVSSTVNDKFKNQLLVQPEKSEKLEKKRNQKDQIIFQNSTSKLVERVTSVCASIATAFGSANKLDIGTFIFSSDNIDIRSIGFTYLIWYISEYEVEQLQAFKVIVSVQRYLKTISSSVYTEISSGKEISISNYFIENFKSLLGKSIIKYNFRGDILYELDPSLIVESTWDSYIPKPQVTAFEHQKTVSDIILSIGKRYNDKPLFAAYVELRVLTNAGKTTSIVNAAAAAQKQQANFSNLKLYAVCAIEPIRRRWANLLAYCEIPYFSYDEFIDRESVEPTESDIGKGFVVLICSPERSIQHLKSNPSGILFYDEPTMYADGLNLNKLFAGVAVLKCMPRFTFLCSATLDIPNHELYDAHKAAFPESVFIDIFSTKIYGYTNLKTNDGIIITPHMCCKNHKDLEMTIERLNKNPLLGKFYNPFAVKQLYNSVKKYISNCPNVDEIFGDVENLTPDTVRITAVDTLKSMLQLSDAQIADVCKAVRTETRVDYKLLGTSDSHKYQHANLIATFNPMEFVETNFKQLVTDIKKEIVSYKHLLSKYEKWQSQRDEIIKRVSGSGEKSEETLRNLLQQHDESKPACCIPEKFQINSEAHISKYGTKQKNGRSRMPFMQVYDCGNVSETVDILFNVGVGIYKPDEMPKNYTNLLMGTKKQPPPKKEPISKLATHSSSKHVPKPTKKPTPLTVKTEHKAKQESQKTGFVLNGELEFVVSNEEIAYGIDCPFGGLFVNSNLSDNISLNTLFQLISRIGRGRKSPYANVFVDKSVVSTILEMIRDDEYENEETDVILSVFKHLSFCIFEKGGKANFFTKIPIKKEHETISIVDGVISLNGKGVDEWSCATKYTKDIELNIAGNVLNIDDKCFGIVF
jgi:hypothetical protein